MRGSGNRTGAGSSREALARLGCAAMLLSISCGVRADGNRNHAGASQVGNKITHGDSALRRFQFELNDAFRSMLAGRHRARAMSAAIKLSDSYLMTCSPK